MIKKSIFSLPLYSKLQQGLSIQSLECHVKKLSRQKSRFPISFEEVFKEIENDTNSIISGKRNQSFRKIS